MSKTTYRVTFEECVKDTCEHTSQLYTPHDKVNCEYDNPTLGWDEVKLCDEIAEKLEENSDHYINVLSIEKIKEVV